MSAKAKSRIAALVMLIFAAAFFAFALTHPTASFPWSNTVSYIIYAVYLVVTAFLFIAPYKAKQ